MVMKGGSTGKREIENLLDAIFARLEEGGNITLTRTATGIEIESSGGGSPSDRAWTILHERRVPAGTGSDGADVDSGITYDPLYEYAIGVFYANGAAPDANHFHYAYNASSTSGNPQAKQRYSPDGGTPMQEDMAILLHARTHPAAFGSTENICTGFSSSAAVKLGTDGKFYTLYTNKPTDVYFVISRRQVFSS